MELWLLTGEGGCPRTHPTSTSGHTEHSERFKNRGVCQYRNCKPFDDNKCGSNSCCRLGTRVTDFTLADRERQIRPIPVAQRGLANFRKGWRRSPVFLVDLRHVCKSAERHCKAPSTWERNSGFWRLAAFSAEIVARR